MKAAIAALLLAGCTIWTAGVHAAPLEVVAAEFPPLVYTRDGVVQGVLADLVKEAGRRIGQEGGVKIYPWARALNMLQSSETPRLIIPLTRSPDREKLFKWVYPLFEDRACLVTLKEKAMQLKRLTDARSMRVGVVLGSPLERQLRALGFGSLDTASDVASNARKLDVGRLDAWYVPETVARYTYREAGLDVARLDFGRAFEVMRIHLGASLATTEEDLAPWRAAFDEMRRDGTFNRLLRTWSDSLLAVGR